MKKVWMAFIFCIPFLLSGCAQKCDFYASGVYVDDESMKEKYPNEVETLIYLEKCDGCGFPATQRKKSNYKVGR